MRGAFQAFVGHLESRCREIVRHHLETATSEFAVGLLGPTTTALPAYAVDGEGAPASLFADEGENAGPRAEEAEERALPFDRAPFNETQVRGEVVV